MHEMFYSDLDGQIVIEVEDKKIGLLGYIAIDSTVNGRSSGGLRMMPNVTSFEIRNLARVMTYKYGFVGLPIGGAKAGIACPSDAPHEKKMSLLYRFGEITSDVIKNRLYLPGPDMNTGVDEINLMLEKIGKEFVRGKQKFDSGFYTALSVLANSKSGAKYLNVDYPSIEVAIEGFGSVGSAVANLLFEEGAKIVAISTSKGAIYDKGGLNIDELLELRSEVGSSDVVTWYKQAKQIEKNKLLELDVGLLCPCARGGSINSNNAEKVNAKIICPGANNPVTSEAEKILNKRKVLSIPDLVANTGGVIGSAMEFGGLSIQEIKNAMEKFYSKKIIMLIENSRREGITIREYAEMVALKNFMQVKKKHEQKNLTNSILWTGLDFVRKGLVPKRILRIGSRRYFKKMLTFFIL